MIRVVGMLWSIAGTVLAGIAIIIVLAVPSFAGHAMQYIPSAALAGVVAGLPVAFVVARMIGKGATS
jgi:MFS superfamily sulfate permease-like transporter